MRIALAQINPLVGDLAGNAGRILEACRQAHQQQADLVVTPELALWGYPPPRPVAEQRPRRAATHGDGPTEP